MQLHGPVTLEHRQILRQDLVLVGHRAGRPVQIAGQVVPGYELVDTGAVGGLRSAAEQDAEGRSGHRNLNLK